MGILSRDELAGVLAHELGHVRNHDILISSVAATIAGAITMLANLAQWALIFGGFGRSNDDDGPNPFAVLLMIVLAPLAATIIHLAISRAREYGADETGAAIHGNPDSLARALEKLEVATSMRPLQVNPAVSSLFIVNPLKGAKGLNFAGLFSTHPPIEERIRRLRSMQVRALT
jgi:heat shock protein HtpX